MKVCISLLKRDFIIYLQGEISESNLQNVQVCLLTHKNSTIVDKKMEVRYATSHVFWVLTSWLFSGYQESNIVPIEIINKTGLTLLIELAFVRIRSELVYVCIFLIIFTQTHLYSGKMLTSICFYHTAEGMGELIPVQSALSLASVFMNSLIRHIFTDMSQISKNGYFNSFTRFATLTFKTPSKIWITFQYWM